MRVGGQELNLRSLVPNEAWSADAATNTISWAKRGRDPKPYSAKCLMILVGAVGIEPTTSPV